MSIDGCQHSFRKLADEELPLKMKEMQMAMESAIPLKTFDTPGFGLMSIMKTIGIEKDFSGCYVLMQGTQPVYVGISRRVLQRLQSHIRGKTHYAATLAYRMAAAESDYDVSRDELMQDERFFERFTRKKKQMRRWRVAWVPISNPIELHLFEVYCAMELKTSKWNTFMTH